MLHPTPSTHTTSLTVGHLTAVRNELIPTPGDGDASDPIRRILQDNPDEIIIQRFLAKAKNLVLAINREQKKIPKIVAQSFMKYFTLSADLSQKQFLIHEPFNFQHPYQTLWHFRVDMMRCYQELSGYKKYQIYQETLIPIYSDLEELSRIQREHLIQLLCCYQRICDATEQQTHAMNALEQIHQEDLSQLQTLHEQHAAMTETHVRQQQLHASLSAALSESQNRLRQAIEAGEHHQKKAADLEVLTEQAHQLIQTLQHNMMSMQARNEELERRLVHLQTHNEALETRLGRESMWIEIIEEKTSEEVSERATHHAIPVDQSKPAIGLSELTRHEEIPQYEGFSVKDHALHEQVNHLKQMIESEKDQNDLLKEEISYLRLQMTELTLKLSENTSQAIERAASQTLSLRHTANPLIPTESSMPNTSTASILAARPFIDSSSVAAHSGSPLTPAMAPSREAASSITPTTNHSSIPLDTRFELSPSSSNSVTAHLDHAVIAKQEQQATLDISPQNGTTDPEKKRNQDKEIQDQHICDDIQRFCEDYRRVVEQQWFYRWRSGFQKMLLIRHLQTAIQTSAQCASIKLAIASYTVKEIISDRVSSQSLLQTSPVSWMVKTWQKWIHGTTYTAVSSSGTQFFRTLNRIHTLLSQSAPLQTTALREQTQLKTPNSPANPYL